MIWTACGAVVGVLRDAAEFVRTETRIFLREPLDHIHQRQHMVEDWNGISRSSPGSLRVERQRNRRSDGVLTVAVTIFVPLVFITGSYYGMKFAPDSSPLHMPEG